MAISDPAWIVRELRAVQRAAAAPGPTLLETLAMRHGTQATLSAASGIKWDRMAAINKGARPTKAERAALAWTVAAQILGPAP